MLGSKVFRTSSSHPCRCQKPHLWWGEVLVHHVLTTSRGVDRTSTHLPMFQLRCLFERCTLSIGVLQCFQVFGTLSNQTAVRLQNSQLRSHPVLKRVLVHHMFTTSRGVDRTDEARGSRREKVVEGVSPTNVSKV
jgi:hypothetical protein